MRLIGKKKKNKLLELEYFDPFFYITYPYNKIMYEKEMLKDEEKLKSYAIFHWLQIGFKVFRLVQNPNSHQSRQNQLVPLGNPAAQFRNGFRSAHIR